MIVPIQNIIEMTDKSQGFNNFELNRIADVIKGLSQRIEWIEVEGQDTDLINYWRQSGIGNLSTFREEIECNCIRASNATEFNTYRHTLKERVYSPINGIEDQLRKWVRNNPEKGSAMYVIAALHFNAPIIPKIEIDPHRELRPILEEILDFLSAIKQAIYDTTDRFVDSFNQQIPGVQKQIESGPIIFKVNPSKRQRILIHFYEDGKMVERKHKDYNDYIRFSTSRKRLAYHNGSLSKLKPLIEDIEEVIQYLSEKAKQRAENELNSLKSNLTVEE